MEGFIVVVFLTTWGPPWGKTLADPKHLLLIRVSFIPELDGQMKNTNGPEASQDQHLDQQAGGPAELCDTEDQEPRLGSSWSWSMSWSWFSLGTGPGPGLVPNPGSA